MRRHSIALLVMITCSLGAGVLAYLVAAPDDRLRIRAGELGFTALDRDRVDAGFAHAAQHHERLARERASSVAARRLVGAWLAALPGSRTTPSRTAAVVRVAGGGTASSRRARAFATWADDLPVAEWRSSIGRIEARGGAGARWVRAQLVLGIAGHRDGARSHRVPVQVQLRRVGNDDELVARPGGWRVADVRIEGTRRGLLSYVDPIVVSGGRIDVVAPRPATAAAARVATIAGTTTPEVTTRYDRLVGAARTTVWLLESPERARAVLGSPRPAKAGDTWTPRPGVIATDATGDDAAGLRRELVQGVLRDLDGKVSDGLLAAVVDFEVRRLGRPRGALVGVDLGPLVAKFGRGESGVARLLAAGAGGGSAGGADISTAALATVAWIEMTRGHAELLELLDELHRGSSPAVALDRSLGMDARQVEVAVARWTRRVHARSADRA